MQTLSIILGVITLITMLTLMLTLMFRPQKSGEQRAMINLSGKNGKSYRAYQRTGTTGKQRNHWNFYDETGLLIDDLILLNLLFDAFQYNDWEYEDDNHPTFDVDDSEIGTIYETDEVTTSSDNIMSDTMSPTETSYSSDSDTSTDPASTDDYKDHTSYRTTDYSSSRGSGHNSNDDGWSSSDSYSSSSSYGSSSSSSSSSDSSSYSSSSDSGGGGFD